MSQIAEYRIVFYFDKRYKKDRYVIVKGDYKAALAMIKDLEASDFAENVSRYWVVDDLYLMQDDHKRYVFKSHMKDSGLREYWLKNNQYRA
jgi:hypothetical protein